MGSVCMSTRTAYTDSFGSGALAPQCDGEYTLIYEKLCLFQDSTDPGSVTVRVRIQAAEVLHGNRADPRGLDNPSFYRIQCRRSVSLTKSEHSWIELRLIFEIIQTTSTTQYQDAAERLPQRHRGGQGADWDYICPQPFDDHCAVLILVQLNRPKTLNAFGDRLGDEVVMALRELNEHPDTIFTVLTGKGRFFSSGADVRGTTIVRSSLTSLTRRRRPAAGHERKAHRRREEARLPDALRREYAPPPPPPAPD